MNKYIRTKDNKIFKVLDTHYMRVPENHRLYGVKVYDVEVWKGILEEDVLKEANTLKELCDIFKVVNINQSPFSFTNYRDFELARFNKNKSENATLYGYIYILLPNGAVRIEPVAKMNEKGDLELL